MSDFAAASRRTSSADLRALAHAMIRQARMLKAAGSVEDARALAGRARALDRLGWSYFEAA